MNRSQSLAALILAAALPLSAEILWNGDESGGTKVFKLLNLEGGATATVAEDPDHGSVFRFHKPSGSNRCESSHVTGWQGKVGDVIYLGWRFKVDMSQNQTTNAVFQWHSYPTSQIQNYPIVVKTISGRLYLEVYNPNGTPGLPKETAAANVRNNLWNIPFTPMTWYSVTLAIKISADVKEGYVEWWYNGEQQTLRNGSTRFICRTWDGTYSDPKWGVYGASGATVTNYVTSLKIATQYAEASPEGATGLIRHTLAPPLARPAFAAGAPVFDLMGRHAVVRNRDALRVFTAD